ncbi:MAG: ribose-phosphate pyrophosphokinase [Theionarchaea archaeon]|nr:ribose-phosphate pyrophosphokinase [Theionarchaea archaeon]
MKVVGPKTDFCLNLAHSLQYDFVEMDRRVFPDGEINPRIMEAPKEVILVNTLSSHCFDPNRYIMEYIFSIKNLKERGTELIILVMPYLPYSRQDAVFREGESFTSKYLLEIFKYLGIKDIFAVTFHLHRQRAVNLIEGITLFDVSGIDALRDYITPGEDPLFLAPDGEAEKWARKMAEPFQGEVAVLQKRRDTATGAIETCGEIPERRNVIIVDDMISTGGTILKALEVCTQVKSRTVTVAAVHGIFSRSVHWDVPLITTNTVENPYAKVDVAPYIAKAIAQKL